MNTFALRLHPNQDLALELDTFVSEHALRAGFILTCVGSLTHAALRLADQSPTSFFEGPFEIVSFVGTLSPDGNHLHISLSDGTGETIGGHLKPGCLIYTTAEIVLGELDHLVFSRPIDPETTYDELVVDPRLDEM